MGYNQNNAGIHLIPHNYRGKTDITIPHDKYNAMIVESKEKKNNVANEKYNKNYYCNYADMMAKSKQKKNHIMNEMIKDVELCNFIMIANKRGEIKQCLCGGKIDYRERLEIRFHKSEKMYSIMMTGKECRDCGRKLVIKSEVIDEIQKFLMTPSINDEIGK